MAGSVWMSDFKEQAEKMGMEVLEVRDWHTPATDYPERKVGSAEIERKNYGRGIYLMEQVKGYDFFEVKKPIPITSLKIDKKQWMVDDPLHWEGMEILGQKAKGNVLVGGLGLGLLIHSLAKNPEVKNVDVVEMNKDVIKLIKPQLPDKKIKIHKGNIFDKEWLVKDKYDTVILDIWVTERGRQKPIWLEMVGAVGLFKNYYPKAGIFIWGMRDRQINPAVFKEPSKWYQDFIKMREREEKLCRSVI